MYAKASIHGELVFLSPERGSSWLVRNDAAVAVGGATNEPRGGANGHDGQGALQSMPFTLGATIFLACTECGLNGTSSK